MFTHTVTLSVSTTGGSISQAIATTADGEDNRDVGVAGSTTNAEITIAFLIANLKSFYLLSDKALTLKTNSTSSPGDTISVAASVPLMWYATAPNANPFTVDVTKFYLTNAGGTAAAVNIRVLVDATP